MHGTLFLVRRFHDLYPENKPFFFITFAPEQKTR